jgi:hypothetical protein
MAYNVLKGIVEGSVDQYGDQEIEGIKVFKSTISASVFYDTDAQSACATMKDVAITKVIGTMKNAVLIFQEDSTLKADYHLTFDGQKLETKNIHAQNFVGSGAGLTNLPHDKFTAPIAGTHIDHGPGLQDVRGTLQLKAGPGLIADDDGLSIGLASTSGLAIRGKNLVIDPTKADSITTGGQNLSDKDVLLVGDVSQGGVHKTTLANLYDNYVNLKIPHAAGETNELQLKGKGGFASAPQLTYDVAQNTLKVEGKIAATSLNVESGLTCGGAIISNIKKIKTKLYEVAADDYTVLCDSIKNPITIMLPPACNNNGRILNIKKTNTNKYNLRSYPVVIKTQEGSIDISDEIVLKMNYSSRTLQSDGENWWVIGTKGN